MPQSAHSYAPLAPIEPPISTSAFIKPATSQSYSVHEGLEPSIRAQEPFESRLPYNGLDRNESSRPLKGHWATGLVEHAQSSRYRVAPGTLSRSEDARYQQPGQTHFIHGLPSISNSNFRFNATVSTREDSSSVLSERDGYNSRSEGLVQDVPPTTQRRWSHYHMPHLPPMSYQHHQPNPHSEADDMSSPASTASRSFGFGMRGWTSPTQPPATGAEPTTTVFSRNADPLPYNYELKFRQQPQYARACGQGDRDRRTIDPPPILELQITDPETGDPKSDATGLFALSSTLIRIRRNGQETTATTSPKVDRRTSRPLTGATICSPYEGKDEHGRAGMFFVFADLSCRNAGHFKLRFDLTRLDPFHMTPGTVHPNVASIVSDPFAAQVAKNFRGMTASSALLKALRLQGLNVPLKKGRAADEWGPGGWDRVREEAVEDERGSGDEEEEEAAELDEDDGHTSDESEETLSGRGSNASGKRKRSEAEG